MHRNALDALTWILGIFGSKNQQKIQSFLNSAKILSQYKLTTITLVVYEVEGWRKISINMMHGAKEADGAAERHEEGKTKSAFGAITRRLSFIYSDE